LSGIFVSDDKVWVILWDQKNNLISKEVISI